MTRLKKWLAVAAAAIVAAIGAVALAGCAEGEIKTLKFEGVEATVENVENGSYELTRPFNIAYRSYDGLSDAAKDFVGYMFSAEGQAIVSEEGYIAVESEEYATSGVAGIVKISGSTSMGPLVQDIVGAYESVNPNVTITVNQNGSGSGITEAQDGTVEIAMVSRDLKEEEELESRKLATDGIAIIVNANSELENVTKAQLKALYEDGTPFEGIKAGISREEGSGTRSAFEELIGIESVYTGTGFDSYNSTQAVITAISNNTAANTVGYVSLGVL